MATGIEIGVEVFTAWLDDPDRTDFARSRMLSYLADPQGAADLIAWLVNVGGALLVRLDDAGLDPHEVLQEIALAARSETE